MNTECSKNLIADVHAACDVMRRGGVILYPTDTIWGLGCDACCAEAVRRIFEIKHRAESKSLITLVDSTAMLERYVDSLPQSAASLMEKGGDRPVTVVLDGPCRLAPEVVAADGSAGFRLTREAFSAALCRELGRPVVSTSANLSGEPSPAVFSEISPEILGAVDYAATYRRDDLSRSLPSKIVKISAEGTLTVIRP